ncbi:WD repeat-containing protein 55-like [Henckelia pumila]|uniref:WD repeat-containing protein 55-like n=1 Tax=Henckelia pumila TaxID=405737 RepID=UPI003C6DD1E8
MAIRSRALRHQHMPIGAIAHPCLLSQFLAAKSGDGTLSVCNLRSNKVQTIFEFSEDELLSVLIMKNGRNVVCGTQTGTLLLYSWGFFKDCSDRFIDLSPNSVDALLKLDEDRIITGFENGIISLVGILPNRVIQPIAEHSEYPVERLGEDQERNRGFIHPSKCPRSYCHCHSFRSFLKLSCGSLQTESGMKDGVDKRSEPEVHPIPAFSPIAPLPKTQNIHKPECFTLA